MEHHGTLSLNLSWAMFSMFNCGMGHQLQIEMDLFLLFFCMVLLCRHCYSTERGPIHKRYNYPNSGTL